MKVGLVNIFSFRPHVHHLMFLNDVLKRSGCDTFFLTCDSGVENCYARAIKGTSRVGECSKCIIGGVRSFPVGPVTKITPSTSDLTIEQLDGIALSSSCTLNRTEKETEWLDDTVVETRESFYSPIASVFESSKNWIKDNQLDAVICFNGRIDLTRAVIYACETLDVPFITHERTWFGDGIQLIPNANCLALGAVNSMVKEYSERPLTKVQASIAGKIIGERFLQRNSLEWRLYNKKPTPAKWPLSHVGKRVLILPSSKNEFAGHSDWSSEWTDNTRALDDLIDVYSFHPKQLVLRCHPNWSENIGQADGKRSLKVYHEWARRRGIYLIDSYSKDSTYDLIQQADIVVMNGGSSAVEAGACGKKVICLGPSPYEKAGFVQSFSSRSEMESESLSEMDTDQVRRYTLRYLYVRSHRLPQYVDYMKADQTTKYRFYEGADGDRIIQMFHSGKILADDQKYSDNERFEDEVIRKLRNQNWLELSEYSGVAANTKELKIQRRFGLAWIDGLREKFSRGDR